MIMKHILLLTFLSLMLPVLAFAAEPVNWGLGFQEAASPVKDRMISFHDGLLMPIITGISLFVLVLLIIVVVRFNRHSNPTPSKTTHNLPLEIIWTAVPVVILIIIAVPSFKLLYYTEKVAETEMTLKVNGYQWAWGFSYPDYEIERFESFMIDDETAKANPDKYTRLLSTDNVVVLPTQTNIEIIVTADDVLHSFAMPSFGIKTDAVPGRLNSTWVNIKKPGTYFGQCSEICGAKHAFMPIEVRAVEKDVFEEWAKIAKDDLEASYAFLRNQSDMPSEPKNILEISEVSGD